MSVVNLPFNFDPRPYQAELMKAILVDGVKRALLVAHRRSGKDLVCLNTVIALACKRVGSHLYALPMQAQAKKVIWSAMTKEGTRFLDRIPKEIIAKVNNTEMSIDLVNGSRIVFTGTDSLDGIIGTNYVTIVLSEFSLHSPVVYPLLSPILRENGGTMILNMTPRGMNHAHDLYQAVKNNPAWYVRVLGVKDTFDNDGNPILTEEDIEQERAAGVSDEMIAQEFHVSWSSGSVGAYFTKELEQADKEGRICDLKVSSRPVWTFWDVGYDGTVCLLIQPNGKYLDMIAALEFVDKDLQFVVNQLRDLARKLNIQFKDHIAPHDFRNREYAAGRSRIEMAQDMGIHFRIGKKLPIDDGINAVKMIFPKLRIDPTRCRQTLQALREYRREYDEVKKIFKSAPLHNWASHSADALRYMATYWSDMFLRPNMDKPLTYNLDEFVGENEIKQKDPSVERLESVLRDVNKLRK